MTFVFSATQEEEEEEALMDGGRLHIIISINIRFSVRIYTTLIRSTNGQGLGTFEECRAVPDIRGASGRKCCRLTKRVLSWCKITTWRAREICLHFLVWW
jgi:hypothetical protein